MTILLFANDAFGTLNGPITNVALSLTLSTGQGALFPNPGAGEAFKLTIRDALTQLNDEIVLCTARAGDVLTIVRAQEGTAAQAWLGGDLVANLQTAGTAAAMVQKAQGGLLLRVRTITSSGTYTPSADCNNIVVELVGGGGGSAGTALTSGAQAAASGAGGGGGYSRAVTTAAITAVTVGAGGNGGAAGANAGVAGGSTSFGAVCSATGGSGGSIGISLTAGSSTAYTAAGGTGSSGSLNISGEVGEGSWAVNNTTIPMIGGYQGRGGSSHLGAGGQGATNAAPSNATNYGAGGGGIVSGGSQAAAAGAKGGPGVIIVWEYT